MSGFKSYAVFFLFASLGVLQGCSEPANRQAEPVFRQIPEIRGIRPEKPVKIKLRRNAKDGYSWEINGNDVDEIVSADNKLRKGLKTE
jgi:hypothetical protein